MGKETVEYALTVIQKQLKPAVIGEDPFRLEWILHKMDSVAPKDTIPQAAIDFALFDIIGKALEVPAYVLLGGLYRDKISLGWGIGIGPVKQVMIETEEAIKRGYKTIKLKITAENPQLHINCMEAIRSKYGDSIKLRIDANQGLNDPQTAIRVIRQLEEFDLELAEQPLLRTDLDGMAEVARQVKVPLMADESAYTPTDVLKIAKKDAAKIINIKVIKPGGLYRAKKMAAIAEAAGLQCFPGGMHESGVGTAASAHFAASTASAKYAGEFHAGAVALEDDLLVDPLLIQDGFLTVPQAPGLGIEVDEKKLEFYRYEV